MFIKEQYPRSCVSIIQNLTYFAVNFLEQEARAWAARLPFIHFGTFAHQTLVEVREKNMKLLLLSFLLIDYVLFS